MVQMFGMIEGRGGLRFTLEAAEGLRVAGDFVGQEFQGDKTMQAGVFGLVYHTHSATTELLDDAVMRDGLADHWRDAMLCVTPRQVNENQRDDDVLDAQLAKKIAISLIDLVKTCNP